MQSAAEWQRSFFENLYTIFTALRYTDPVKINVTLQIELPDDAATVDGMEDINATDLVEKVRKDVEYFTFSAVDSSDVRVSAIINGEVQAGMEPTVDMVVETPTSGVLPMGTRVIVTYCKEPTTAEVIGYDQKYKLHKVRTTCGTVLLRKVQQAA